MVEQWEQTFPSVPKEVGENLRKESQTLAFIQALPAPKAGTNTAAVVEGMDWLKRAAGKTLPADDSPKLMCSAGVPWCLKVRPHCSIEGPSGVPGNGLGVWLFVRSGAVWVVSLSLAHSKGRLADSFAESSRRVVNSLCTASELTHGVISEGMWHFTPAGFTSFVHNCGEDEADVIVVPFVVLSALKELKKSQESVAATLRFIYSDFATTLSGALERLRAFCELIASV